MHATVTVSLGVKLSSEQPKGNKESFNVASKEKGVQSIQDLIKEAGVIDIISRVTIERATKD